MLVQDGRRWTEAKVAPDGPGLTTVTTTAKSTPASTTTLSLLTLSLVGLLTSVLAAAASSVVVTHSVDMLLRLPMSAELGTFLSSSLFALKTVRPTHSRVVLRNGRESAARFLAQCHIYAAIKSG